MKGGSAEEPPLILRKEVKALWTTRPHSPALISLATRVGLTEAMDKAVALINDPKTSAADKRELTQLLAERRSEAAQRLLLQQFSAEKSTSRRIEIMTALQRFESDQIAPALLDRWEIMSSREHETAQNILSSRANWSLALLQAVDQGKLAREAIKPPVYWRWRIMAARPSSRLCANIGVSCAKAMRLARNVWRRSPS